MKRKEKRWLLLLKGVVKGVDSLTIAEVKELQREADLYHLATEASGIALDLADILAEKRLMSLWRRRRRSV